MDTSIISLNGIEILSEKQIQLMNRLLNGYYPRIQRQIKNLVTIKAHIKNYEKEGKVKKFSFHIQIIAPTKIFEADATDWDLARTIHKALNKVMNEIEHELHSSDQHDRIRRLQNKQKKS